MEGQWTFSDLDIEWVHETYDTKEEAIESAKEIYDKGFYVGQLEHRHGVNYSVVNREKIT